MKTESTEHLKPRSQYAEDAVQLAIAGKWDEAVKLNKFIVELNEDLFSSHAHMLTHMLRTGRPHAHERRRRTVRARGLEPPTGFPTRS